MNQEKPNNKKILSVKEVSEFLKLPLSTVYDLVAKGRIKGTKIGKHWRFFEEDVRHYLLGTSPSSVSLRKAPADPQRRQYPRINSEFSADLSGALSKHAEIVTAGIVSNLGEGGLFFQSTGLYEESSDDPGSEARFKYEIGDPIQLVFKLPRPNASAMTIEGRVVHRVQNGQKGIGIKFRHLSKENQGAIRDYVG